MRTTFLAAAAVLALMAGAAQAAPFTTYGVTLSNPGGWYQGSGNPNQDFTVTTLNDGTQIAWRAKYRQDPATVAAPAGVYSLVGGLQPTNNARWIWNYELGVICPGQGVLGCASGTTNIQGLLSNSTISLTNMTTGITNTRSLMHPDDDTWHGPIGGPGSEGNYLNIDSYSAENSENGAFLEFPTAMFDPDAANYYRFTANIINGTQFLGSGSMDVSINGAQMPTNVPEPATISVIASGLIGAGYLRRRKAKKAASA